MFLSLFLTVSFINFHYRRLALSSCGYPTIIPFKPNTKLEGSSLRCVINSFPSGGLFSKIEGLFFNRKLNYVDAFIEQYASCSVKDEYNSSIANLAKVLADAFYNRAVVFIDQGDLDRAIICINQAINLIPYVAEYFFTRAKVYLDKKEYALTIEDCTKAIELNPNCVTDYYYYRGIAYKKIGDNDRAIADFSFVINLDNNNVEAHKQRSCIYAEKGNDSLALRDFVQELKLRFQ